MKKGINKDYDELRNKLFELRIKIQLLQRDSSKKEELKKYLEEAKSYSHQMAALEAASIGKKH